MSDVGFGEFLSYVASLHTLMVYLPTFDSSSPPPQGQPPRAPRMAPGPAAAVAVALTVQVPPPQAPRQAAPGPTAGPGEGGVPVKQHLRIAKHVDFCVLACLSGQSLTDVCLCVRVRGPTVGF